MQHTILHIHADYKKIDDSIPKDVFINICSEFNIGIIDYLLEGKELHLGHQLSTLSIVRKERDPRAPAIDWGESNKYKAEILADGEELYNKETGKGVKWHIYHTDSEYFKYYWRKGKCKVKNKSVYRFDATRGVKGNKGKLMELLKRDDLAYLKFKKN